MTTFLIAAVVLILLPLAFLLPVFLKRRNEAVSSPYASRNLHILREQLAELERERATGLLGEEDFREAKEDLERRLLEENAQGEPAEAVSPQSHTPNSPFAAALLALLLVVGGFSGYLWLGAPQALDGEHIVHPAGNMPTAEQIAAMLAHMEERVKENPADEEGWLNLASAYQMLGRPAEAVAAYGKAEARIGSDPDLLTGYAEVLALTAMPEKPDSKPEAFKGKPRRLLLEALKLEPEHPKALFLAGAAAFEAGDKQEAASHWEKLLPHVEPGSELQELLSANIESIRKEARAGRK